MLQALEEQCPVHLAKLQRDMYKEILCVSHYYYLALLISVFTDPWLDWSIYMMAAVVQ
jgi:hypothetical protein